MNTILQIKTLFLRCLILFICAISLSACSHDGNNTIASPDSIILFIGDGMGTEQRKAAQWLSVGMDDTLRMDTLDYTGASITASANSAITDSAAGATAISTGIKTNNGVIGMDSSLNALVTILETARSRGMSTGLVTNTQISHATPAAFAAHVKSRNMMTEIARQLLATKVDVLLGGGENEFLPTGETGQYPAAGKRTDGRNLITEAIADGYVYVNTKTALSDIDVNNTNKLIGLFADEGMVHPFSPTLALMTDMAIQILKKNPKGFFLMVEGGQIDWAGHTNDATNNIQDTIDFDSAVTIGIHYLNENNNTLLIVAADHETGGMSASLSSSGAADEDGPFNMPNMTPFYINWSTKGHTAVNVPVTSSGPQADSLIGTFENTYIYDVMMQHIQ